MKMLDGYFDDGQYWMIKFVNGQSVLFVGYDEEWERNAEEQVFAGTYEDCTAEAIRMDIEIKESLIG